MKTFHTELSVRFGDVDLARIMYYPHITNYIHIAMEEFIQEACGFSYYQLISERGIGFPIVNLTTDFRQGLPYGTKIQAEVAVQKIGNTSLTLRIRFYKNTISPETLAVESVNTLVCVQLHDFVKIRVPDDVREKFVAYMLTK
ncbi:MAG TPA: thioesterase family protein [Candidatus Kapabacteria bacterium]|nr:thioesterase family protein [Candidatus Kapabacteria bacterium]